MILCNIESDEEWAQWCTLTTWLPAHLSMASVGSRLKSDGKPITWTQWRGNRLADAVAKAHAIPGTLSEEARDLIKVAIAATEYSVALLGHVTREANTGSALDTQGTVRSARDSAPTRGQRDEAQPTPSARAKAKCKQSKRKALVQCVTGSDGRDELGPDHVSLMRHALDTEIQAFSPMALVEGSRTCGSTVLAQAPVLAAKAKPKAKAKAQNAAARWKRNHDAAKVRRVEQAEATTNYCLQELAQRQDASSESHAGKTEASKASGAERLAALRQRLKAKEANAA